MSNQETIKDTLNTIRKALEEDNTSDQNKYKETLILDKLIKDDGTIQLLNNEKINKEEVKLILEKKISNYFDENLDKWLDKNIPDYLNKHFNKK